MSQFNFNIAKTKGRRRRKKQLALLSTNKNGKAVYPYGINPIGHTVNIKPLSTNRAWQGRRFKTPEYHKFQSAMIMALPNFLLPPPPYKITYEFGFSNKLSDFDNGIKQTTDVLCKRYGFDDRDIYEAVIRKKIVDKGKEYISFVIETLVD